MKTLLIALAVILSVTLKAEDGIVVIKEKEVVNIQFQSASEGWATLQIRDLAGEVILEQQMVIGQGANTVPVFFVSKLKKGNYTFVLKVEDKVYTSKYSKA